MPTYEYFLKPLTPLANQRINEIPNVILINEIDNLYLMPNQESIKQMFQIKNQTQGTKGRNSQQPIDFRVYRRTKKGDQIKAMTGQQLEFFLRSKLHLKPMYLQTAKNI